MKHRHSSMDPKTFRAMFDMARIGLGNKFIKKHSKLSDYQITYRCKYAKDRLGFKKGLRVTWREGGHPMVWDMLEAQSAITEAEFNDSIAPLLVEEKK